MLGKVPICEHSSAYDFHYPVYLWLSYVWIKQFSALSCFAYSALHVDSLCLYFP